jgi:hypothetical protein
MNTLLVFLITPIRVGALCKACMNRLRPPKHLGSWVRMSLETRKSVCVFPRLCRSVYLLVKPGIVVVKFREIVRVTNVLRNHYKTARLI